MDEISAKVYQYGYKAIIAQLIITFACCLNSCCIGMMNAFLIIVVESVSAESYRNETTINFNDTSSTVVLLDNDQLSIYVSLTYLIQPMGTITSILLIDKVGRKFGMALLCLPQIATWIFSHNASSTAMFYISSALIGLSLGFLEITNYIFISESMEPRLRGIFTQFLAVSFMIGMLSVTGLSMLGFTWKTIALICPCVTVTVLVMFLFIIPESPAWLLLKDKVTEAESSLCWLRGWVSADQIRDELADLSKFSKKTTHHVDGIAHSEKISTCTSMGRMFKKLFEPCTWKPLKLVLLYSFFSWCAASMGSDRYLLMIYNSIDLAGSSLFCVGIAASMIGIFLCAVMTSKLGKRKTSLISMFGSSLITLSIGVSFYINELNHVSKYIFATLFILRYLFMCIGILSIVWTLLAETIPMKSRDIAPWFFAILCYIMQACFTKTFHSIVELVDFHGCFIIYGMVGFVGCVYLYKYLPETEMKTLAQIEEIFSSNKMHKHFFKKPECKNKTKIFY